MDPRSRHPPGRILRWLLVLDLLFKVIIGASLIQSFAIDDGHDRLRAALVMVALGVPLVGGWVLWLAGRLRLVRDAMAVLPDEEILRRGAETAYGLPLRMAAVWAAHWVLFSGTTLVALAGGWPAAVRMAPLSLPAFALFEATMVGGALSLAYSLAAWMLGATAGALSVAARARQVRLRVRGLSIRQQLVGMAFALCLTPTCWMGTMAYMSHRNEADESGFLFAFGLYVLGIAIWGPLCAWFLGRAVTAPVERVAAALDEVARAGRGQEVARVPIYQRDEVGHLADRANAMIDVLEATGRDLERAMKDLEERERFRQELAIAARIQTSILPRTLALEGLESAARMVTTTEVGGDYYDVLPTADGGWMAIGDVAGHGLAAGMLMMMAQAAVAALVQRRPDATPGEILAALNTVVHENVRGRLGQDDFLTLTLLRYFRDGRVVFAGAHEDLLVCRAATGRCEVLATSGVWMGMMREAAGRLPESQLVLRHGDLLVLRTDGITEARDAGERQFGPERLIAVVEEARDRPPAEIVDRVFAAARSWRAEPEDDQTLLVVRYLGPVV